MTASVQKKTVTTVFLHNFRTSRPEVFFEIGVQKYLRKIPRKRLRWSVFVGKIKTIALPQMFS